MVDYLYQWLQNLSFYMVIIHVAIQLIPNNGYKKYIRFYTGLILIVLLIGPVLKVFGINETFQDIYDSSEYKRQVKEMEEATKYLEDITLEGIQIEK